MGWISFQLERGQVQTPSCTSEVLDVAVRLKTSLVPVWPTQTQFTLDLLWPSCLFTDAFGSDRILLSLCKSLGGEERRLEISSNPSGYAWSHLISKWHAVGLGNVMTGSTSSLALSRCSKLYWAVLIFSVTQEENVLAATSTKTLDLLW